MKLGNPNGQFGWNDDPSRNFSVDESRRRRSVVTAESEEVRASVKAKRRNTDDDDGGRGNDEDEDENVEIIGECRRRAGNEFSSRFSCSNVFFAQISLLIFVESYLQYDETPFGILTSVWRMFLSGRGDYCR